MADLSDATNDARMMLFFGLDHHQLNMTDPSNDAWIASLPPGYGQHASDGVSEASRPPNDSTTMSEASTPSNYIMDLDTDTDTVAPEDIMDLDTDTDTVTQESIMDLDTDTDTVIQDPYFHFFLQLPIDMRLMIYDTAIQFEGKKKPHMRVVVPPGSLRTQTGHKWNCPIPKRLGAGPMQAQAVQRRSGDTTLWWDGYYWNPARLEVCNKSSFPPFFALARTSRQIYKETRGHVLREWEKASVDLRSLKQFAPAVEFFFQSSNKYLLPKVESVSVSLNLITAVLHSQASVHLVKIMFELELRELIFHIDIGYWNVKVEQERIIKTWLAFSEAMPGVAICTLKLIGKEQEKVDLIATATHEEEKNCKENPDWYPEKEPRSFREHYYESDVRKSQLHFQVIGAPDERKTEHWRNFILLGGKSKTSE